ncbi:Rieske 2Fe-2S domain-containing protein [uncultured Nocardioides sp.]|mgnify:FL=1|uniref:Rieske (2Fe-2S) protein n=1 Tax=uncultured Nocardioides sp. TaxID=198441 RepID=UPI00261F0D88|nr:Rieske 2Fe-2S domain-containing protein [uncultured Nocardioides sp.]
MTEVVRVPLGDPAGRERWTVTHEDRSYLVLDLGDRLVVTDALCPHKQNPLAAGLVRDGCLVCPGHWYAFDLATGACRNAAETPLPLHPVVAEGEMLYAEVKVEPELSWSERLRAYARGSS